MPRMAIHASGTEKLLLVLVHLLSSTLAESEQTTNTTFDPYSVDCCENSYCQRNDVLGIDSYCGFQRRSTTLFCTNDEFLEPRRKRAIEGGIGEQTTTPTFPGGMCECTSGYEIRDSGCQLAPVECCDNADCFRRRGIHSVCGSRNFSDTKTCPDEGGVFPDLRKKRNAEADDLPGFCECKEGFYFFVSVCRSVQELKGCCSDRACQYIFGNNSVCTNAEDKPMCFGGERRKRGARFISTTPDPFVGECACLPGYTLVGITCVQEQEPGTCCSDEECEEFLGQNSVCGEPGIEANQEECESRALTSGRTFVGECKCAPGFVLVNQSCIQEQLICCSDADCVSKGISNSTCRFDIGAALGVCPDDNPDEYNPFTINPRKRREIGGITTPDLSLQNTGYAGECRCNRGYSRVNLTCTPSAESRASTTLITLTSRTTLVTSPTVADSTQTPGTPGSSTGYRCYNFTCTDNDCTDQLLLVDTNYCITLNSQCYVTKTCSNSGINYIFGCDSDQCVEGSTPTSDSCYSVSCDSATTMYCNNGTSVVDEFQCEASGAEVIFMNVVLHVFVNIVYVI